MYILIYVVRVHLGVQQKMDEQLKNLAVLTEDLGLSQRSFYLIDNLNKLCRDRSAAVTCYTTSVIPPVMKALFPFMKSTCSSPSMSYLSISPFSPT